MEVDDEGSDSPMMNMEDERNVQAEDLLSEPLPTIDRAEPWHAQFPTSWLPIITRDIARQRRQVILLWIYLYFFIKIANLMSFTEPTTAIFRRLHQRNVLEAKKSSDE